MFNSFTVIAGVCGRRRCEICSRRRTSPWFRRRPSIPWVERATSSNGFVTPAANGVHSECRGRDQTNDSRRRASPAVVSSRQIRLVRVGRHAYFVALCIASLALPTVSFAEPAVLSAKPSACSLSLPTVLPTPCLTAPPPFWVAPSIRYLLISDFLRPHAGQVKPEQMRGRGRFGSRVTSRAGGKRGGRARARSPRR